MALLQPHIVFGDKFTWTKDGGSAEISDLGPGFKLEPVYDDACDEGFTVLSPRTGKTVVFRLDVYKYDGNGEVYAYRFQSVSPGTNFVIILYND